MKIYKHLDDFEKTGNAVVTIGTFDGVHLGHRKIISRLIEVARQNNAESVILTFFPHPRMILHPEDQNLKLITTINERALLLEQLGVDHLIITPFTRDFSNLSAETYIRQILVEKIGTKKIVIGFDHHFGKDREGDLKQLQKHCAEYNYEVEEIPEQDIHDVKISSTQIRQSLLSGDVNTANQFLGYPFSLHGQVIKGDQLGRTLGFPTANLLVEESYKLIPADGIYAVKVRLAAQSGRLKDNSPQLAANSSQQAATQKAQDPQLAAQSTVLKADNSNLKAQTSKPTTHNPQPSTQVYSGMAYIGNRPTINGMSRNIEVNIFDFERDIYREYISIEFLHFIRGDIRFDDLEALKQQISEDKQSALTLLC